MRTREEQIEELARLFSWPHHPDDGHAQNAEDMILEAERRAEQRIWAEIGDEVKKLRRENSLARERVSQLFDSYGSYYRPCKQFVMQALDSARENAND